MKEYPEEVRFETKKVRRWGLPFNRIDCESCTLWHIPNNTHHPTGDELREACKSCRLLHRGITKLVKKATCTTLEQQLASASVHSNYPLKYLSPTNKAERVSKLSKERKNLTTELSHVRDFDYNLNDKQHTAELLEIVRSVNQKGSHVIEELCSKGDQVLSNECNPLREVWLQDVIERLEYERDQRKNGMSFSHENNVVYIQRPSVRTLKYYIDANLEGPGDCMKREEERKHYLVMLEQKKGCM